MPRFFFDIINADKLTRDDFGADMSGIEEARDQAISLLPDIARDDLPDGDVHDFVCEVRSETGRIVYRARLMLRAGTVDEPGRSAA